MQAVYSYNILHFGKANRRGIFRFRIRKTCNKSFDLLYSKLIYFSRILVLRELDRDGKDFIPL